MNGSQKDNEKEYEVERVLDKRTRCGKVEYYLKWLKYNDSANSWEPEENLNCDKLVNDFEERMRRENENNQPES